MRSGERLRERPRPAANPGRARSARLLDPSGTVPAIVWPRIAAEASHAGGRERRQAIEHFWARSALDLTADNRRWVPSGAGCLAVLADQ